MGSAWHFGNTTVRNPQRIRDGLFVLQNSSLNGNLGGKAQEIAFADALDSAEVVSIANKNRDYSDLGRKWRSCFSQLGFITHKFTNAETGGIDRVINDILREHPIEGLTGRHYEITPSGQRMINADSLQQQNECMLRALLAYQIPSVIESRNGEHAFSPFIFIIRVLLKLSTLNDNRGLSKTEMALVQVCRSQDEINQVVNDILAFRSVHDNEQGRVNKRRRERLLLEQIAVRANVAWETLRDYADVNFRYPRLTGLVSFKGKRIVINSNKLPVIIEIINRHKLIGLERASDYLIRLWNGAELPTDNEVDALVEIDRLKQTLIDVGFLQEELPQIPVDMPVADINQVRMKLEEMYQKYLEEKYAEDQRQTQQVREIIAYLKTLDRQQVDEEFDIEIDDGPSYLEWSVWRAFLAINNLANKPHEARRFKVDQDFFPISHASGGGADMIFEFDQFVLVVEVTLSTSSRQEAMEGEPVRRHVAKEKKEFEHTNKPVYGLFLATSIDNNTAETFRIGVWYRGDDPEFINIVPMTLAQFIKVMEKFELSRFENEEFRSLMDGCLIPRNAHAPAWKREIDKQVTAFVG